ncbi:MAG: endonuclease domain-containing protein [Hyphomonadaceae bacterium]|nr:endonuclease domain-containing protein [Hyphomonadaceae bacterium]
MTEGEVILWSRLRRRQLEGHRFRRQHPVLSFVADFACVEARLIVEVDGSAHSSAEAQEHDAQREYVLARAGWRTLRVSDDDVRADIEFVLDAIRRSIARAPSGRSATTSPVNGGGKRPSLKG